MNVFRDDLLKNKYFLVVVGVVLLIAAYFYIREYNSIENGCRRRYEKVSSYFGAQNRLQELTLDTATQQLIDECISQSSN
jgi:hypothetical protein